MGAALVPHLSPEEHARWQAFPVVRRRDSFLAGRYAARKALAQVAPDLSGPELIIRQGIFQQPVLSHPRLGGWQVSISHTEGAAFAIAYPHDLPAGADVESVTPDRARRVSAYITSAERLQAEILDWPPDCLPLLAWTAREALAKALRTGLTSSLIPLYALDTVVSHGTTACMTYRHFSQFQALSYVKDGWIWTLAFPAGLQVSGWPVTG